MTSHTFVMADREENILGCDILKGKLWQLSKGSKPIIKHKGCLVLWTQQNPQNNLSGKGRKTSLLKMAPVLAVSN